MAPPAVEASVTSSNENAVVSLRKLLTSESVPLAKRFRALFSLKHIAVTGTSHESLAAIQAIAAAFSSPSALLKHELAYCLGQTQNLEAVPFLRAVLENRDEDSMVRHESAEALGALGDQSSLALMRQMRDDSNEAVVVRETCDIAVDRIEWQMSEKSRTEQLHKSDFSSIDPAPPLAQTSSRPSIDELQHTLMDTGRPLFDRYRAMFALRDLASPPNAPTAVPAVGALATGFKDSSALFRHEIAFVFGQLSHPASIQPLYNALANRKEESMVRHEAAEALGSLGDEPGVEDMLKEFLHDEELVVRDSVLVALDMAEHERSGETEYATIPQISATA